MRRQQYIKLLMHTYHAYFRFVYWSKLALKRDYRYLYTCIYFKKLNLVQLVFKVCSMSFSDIIVSGKGKVLSAHAHVWPFFMCLSHGWNLQSDGCLCLCAKAFLLYLNIITFFIFDPFTICLKILTLVQYWRP